VAPVVVGPPVGAAPVPAAASEIAARTKVMIDADDGHALALWSRRPAVPKGAIVLLHGRTWSGVPDFDLEVDGKSRSLMRSLAEAGWAAYALDLRGYGATQRDASGWNTPDRAAKDLAVAIAHVRAQHPELAPPAVLGWSLGSLVAQLAAQRDAASMSALVLYGYPRDPDRAGKGGGAVGAKPARAANTAAAAASDFITPGAIDRASVDAFVAAALAADPVRADWRAMEQFGVLDPAKVKVPTLVIHGAGDPFAPVASQAKLFSRLGQDDRAWVIVDGGDHAAHLEDCGGRFVHAVVAFLERR
jgi:pimeloyl-ACP methyl ester carboxylesterase